MTNDAERSRLPGRLLIYLTIIVFFVLVGTLVAGRLYVGYHMLSAPGPNTVGEAGKVYYAKRCCSSSGLIAAGDRAPFYPSFHGVLLHATVGAIGRAANLSTTEFYYVGRGISLLSTIIALGLCVILLRRWRTPWWGTMPLLLVFFAAYRVTQHTYSYRPDNWLLMISTLSCYLLVVHPDRRSSRVLLAVLPAIAFFVKATGLALLAAIVLSLIVQKRRRDAVICAITSPALILLSVAAIDAISDGAYLAGMRNAANVGYSYDLLLSCLNVRLMWVPLLVPLFLLRRVSRPPSGPAGEQNIVTIFWAVGLGSAAFASTRMGSNSNYFLEAFTFGMVLTFNWLALRIKAEFEDNVPLVKTALPGVTILLLALGAISPLHAQISNIRQRGEPLFDPAYLETRRFHRDRQSIVNALQKFADENGRKRTFREFEWLCLSNDPGLNVMLDKPVFIQPLLTAMMIKKGTLDARRLVDPIRQRRVATVVLTGYRRNYHGIQPLPDIVRAAIADNYRRVSTTTSYIVLLPRPLLED